MGGGVRTLKDIESLLKSGADKVTINTQAVYDNNLIKEASKHFWRPMHNSRGSCKKAGQKKMGGFLLKMEDSQRIWMFHIGLKKLKI